MKKTKRTLSLLTAVCVMTSALSGCQSDAKSSAAGAPQTTSEETQMVSTGASSASGEPSDDVTEITYWYSWTGATQENNMELTELFNETVGKEKGIHVTAEYQGTYDELHQKLQAAYVANETPEVTVMEIGSIRTFAENGVLEPLDNYVAEAGVDMNDFYDGLMENCYVDEVCYGFLI